MSFIVATLLSNQKILNFKRDFSECATVHLSDEEAEENDEKKVDLKTMYSLLEKARKATTHVTFYESIKEHLEKGLVQSL